MMVPARWIVVGTRKYFLPWRDALADRLRELGAALSPASEIPVFTAGALAEAAALDREGGPGGSWVVVVGIHDHPPPRVLLGPDAVIAGVQTEQLPSPVSGGGAFGARWLTWLRQRAPDYDVLFDWRPEVEETPPDLAGPGGPRPLWLPHGHWDGLAAEATAGEPIWDCCFIGAPDGVDDRRARILARLGARFSLHPETHGLWGARKSRALRASRVALNLHYDAGRCFESPRVYESLAHGVCLLSEAIADPRPFQPGRDFAMLETAAEEDAPAMVENALAALLADPARRLALARQGLATARAHPLDAFPVWRAMADAAARRAIL